MLRRLFVASGAALLVGLSLLLNGVDTAASQAQPREGRPSSVESQERGGERTPAEPRREPGPSQGQAQPRPRETGPPDDRRGDDRRRTGPPPRTPPPPAYYRTPRVYPFPPVHVQRSYYYHPYFGFYFGPYYGPYYPFPGPAFGPSRYMAAALRTRVRPVDTQIYVNGYYAGVADDFDGIFQRLYLPSGGHDIEFRLDGYRTFRTKVYLQAGDTRDITHQMYPAPGTLIDSPRPLGPLPPEWRESATAPAGGQPASPFGILTVRVDPADAQIAIDGEVWLATEALNEITLHVPAGRHLLEVRKDGYETFRVEIELAEGAATSLNVRLTR